MTNLSLISKKRLDTCDPKLQQLVIAVAEEFGQVKLMVVCGHRGQAEQNAAFAKGTSKLKWPKSKHNALPSKAVDLAPIVNGVIPWNDLEAFKGLGKLVKQKAKELGIAIEWGGDWTRFKDYPHFQLKD